MEAIPIYPMMTNCIPKGCLEEIQRLQRNFIWGDTDDVRKYHAVGWEVVTTPKCYGGLGLRRLDEMNKACILKLGWKLKIGASVIYGAKFSEESIIFIVSVMILLLRRQILACGNILFG
jgi:hypothetical protein